MPANTENRSREVQEIMGRMPSWITRWGITVIGVTVAIILSWSYFLKYPDVVEAKCVIMPGKSALSISATVPAADIEKIKKGQKAFVKVRAMQHVLVIPAQVVSIPDIIKDSGNIVDMAFTDRSAINTNPRIFEQSAIAGTTEIYTEERSVFERIFQHAF